MDNPAVLTLAGLCLGIALTGLFAVLLWQGPLRERFSLAIVYVAFIAMVALPLVKSFVGFAFLSYMPLLLIMLLVLPPALYHYIAARTATGGLAPIPRRDLVLPLTGAVVSFGFWILPTQAQETLFVVGDLPEGMLPAILAIATFALIMIWLVVSFIYLVAILRELARYRARIRQLYSDLEERDLRWVEPVMVLLVLVWAVGAFSLADDNLAGGTLFVEELFLALIGSGLMLLNLFASTSPRGQTSLGKEAEPDLKYARSALTSDHAAKLAGRVERVMQEDKLYLDPNLSLQRLSQHVGALPNQVSQTLNQEIGATFFDYVARWRIEASKPLICAGKASVLTIALDVGFNSRSTFYKAFKRETGMTPKSYHALHRDAGSMAA